MRVRVKGFLALREVMGDAHDQMLDVPQNCTLREALRAVADGTGNRFRAAMFDPETGLPLPHNQVLVNGRHYRYLPGGLETVLAENDSVSLFPPAAGG